MAGARGGREVAALGCVLELKRIRRIPMNFGTDLGVGAASSQRAAGVTALVLWTAGFALAGAIGLQMHHAATANRDRNEPSSWAATSEPTADIAEEEGTLYMPVDVIVGRRSPATGVMMMQKP
jgi:hypothetical protein